jgi:glycosyltransferase involved in cell wall biosynthesis
MRILYLTQWFKPEPNIIKGITFVRALEAAGHDVTVVTGFPNYPTGRLYPGYRLRPIRRETIDGVRIVRLPLYPSHDASAVRRSLNFLSFFVSVLVYALVRRARYDIAYVYHPPITVGLAMALAGLVRPLPFALDVQDLWPDTIAATGMAGTGRLTGLLGALCRFSYARASAIIVQSEGMRRALIERGVPAGKLTTIHNWASDAPDQQAARDAPTPNGRFTIVYGGNLGRAQGLETVIDAAAILGARDDIDILLYGDGVEEAALCARAAAKGVSRLRFMGRVRAQEMQAIFARADALLLHLRDDPLFAITIPSKTQAYLAQGRPIIAGIAGDAAAMLRESGAAIVVPPGDAATLAAAMAALADLPPARRVAMGEAGRRYYRERLSFDRAMHRTAGVLRGIYPDGQSRNQAATS